MLKTRVSLVCTIVLASVASVGCSAQAGAQATPRGESPTEASTYSLPGNEVFPEGVAYDPATKMFYVGSTTDGTIFRGDLETGERTVFAEGGAHGRTAVTGLRVDADRLYAAGRRTGRVFVYDLLSGDLLGRFANGLNERETLINDIAVTPDGAAYVTDSFSPSLYRIGPEALRSTPTPDMDVDLEQLEVFIDFTGTVFGYEEGFNANGIVATPDGAYLLIVSFNSGRLFRVEIATKTVTEVDLGSARLDGGDGMALHGRDLYVVQDNQAAIVRVAMTEDVASGRISEEITDPAFDFPTTMALIGDGTALVVNSQLDMPSGSQPDLPFTISRITLSDAGNAGATPSL